MKNPHYTHEFLCQKCGIKTIRKTKNKLPQKYCSSICGQKARIGYKMNEEKSIKNLIVSFEKKVIKKEGCWEWKGHIAKTGYASFSSRYLKQSRAHRISYIIHKGKIPDGFLILHSCHNRSCTNPEHLRIGTNKENIQDKCKAFRQFFNISEQKIMGIKIIMESKKFSVQEIAKMFNVRKSCIYYIQTTGENQC